MPLTIRDIHRDEFDILGQLMVDVYSRLQGFPAPQEQPLCYEMLIRIAGVRLQPPAA